MTPIMRAVTDLGNAAVLAGLILVVGLAWWWRRTWRPLGLLAGAYLGAWVLSETVKAARTPAWSGPAAPARPPPTRSPARPRLGVRALGELPQELVCFSHDLQRRTRARQLGLQALVAAAHPLQLDLVGSAA